MYLENGYLNKSKILVAHDGADEVIDFKTRIDLLGDKKSLKDLLTKDMRENFESAIEERNKNNIKSELTFIGVKSSVVENFEKTATALFFTVKFVSEIISVKRDKDNKVIEGDPNKIKTVIDRWKFTRPKSSISPNWYLSEIKNS